MENMDIVKIVKRTVYITNKVFATLRSIVIHRKFKSQFKSYIIKLGWNCNEVIQGEEQYKNKWSQLSKRVEPYSYRLFSKYCGANSDIIPEDIGHSIIEEILNPRKHRQTYEDKNLFHVFIGEKKIGYCFFMFVGQLPFGEYTDEIIEYCKKQKNQILL